MNRTLVVVFALAGLVLLPALASAQTAAVQTTGTAMMIVDPVGATVTSYPFAPVQSSRGHTYGPDGMIYASWWTTNGIGVMDPATGAWTTLVNDTTNRIMGAPYQPVINNEAVGGPGIWCIDGNPIPTTITTLSGRNTFLVDINAKTFKIDGWWESVASPFIPMSDAYGNPHVAGEFVGVGFSTSDYNISGHTIQGGPSQYKPRTIATLNHPCQYDALIHEDTKLYAWASNAATTTLKAFIGFECVDLTTGKKTDVPVTGITTTPGVNYAAVWNEPWEMTGRHAYLVFDLTDTLYQVDLSKNPAPAVAIVTKPVLATGTYSTARENQESQLSSYTNGKTGRVFHLNFGANMSNAPFVLAPTVVGGYGGPIVLPPAMELWIIPDLFTALAVWNVLPGAMGKTVGVLDANGEADVKFDLGVMANLDALWVAVVVKGGNVLDMSNVINVKM